MSKTHRVHHQLTVEELEPRIAPAAGDLDPTFGDGGLVVTPFPGGGRNLARAAAIQADGKIVVVGESNQDFYVLRYGSDGSLDPMFGVGGVAHTDFGLRTWDGAAAVAIQPDGKIVVVGKSDTDFALARYDSNGSLDMGFGGSGKVTTDIGADDDVARSVVLQADGRIVVAGWTSVAGNRDFAVARYNTDGSLDTSLGGGDGLVTTDLAGCEDEGYSVAIQADGKIVVAGRARNLSTNECDVALARYDSDGALDTTFGTDGKVTPPYGAGNNAACAVAIQSDGKIVAAGAARNGDYADFALARYNGDGSLDTTFDGDGKVTTDFSGGSESALTVAIQPDGKIVAAGSGFCVARYNVDGSLDTTFGDNGKLTTDFGGMGEYGRALIVCSDGKIVVAGHTRSAGIDDYDFALARYNTDGSLDATFDGDGKVTTDFGSGDDAACAVVIQPDGKVVVAGMSKNEFALARYSTDGSLDATFDGDGMVTTAFDGEPSTGRSVALQADGKIVVAGRKGGSFALTRYNSDGSLDTSFDGDGMVTTNLTRYTGAYDVAIQIDGKIVVAGTAYTTTGDAFALLRYNPDGSLDTAFGADGKVTTAFDIRDACARALEIQPNGKIVVAGYTRPCPWNWRNTQFALARYNSDGSLDVSFGGDGMVTTGIKGREDYAYAMAVQPDGRIVVAGETRKGHDVDWAIMRFCSDGSLDTTFDDDGRLTTDCGVGRGIAQAVALQTDGRIVVAGTWNGVSSSFDFGLARYNSDGSLDAMFTPDGKVTTNFGGVDVAYAVAIQSDGMILAVGTCNGDFAVARYQVLNPDMRLTDSLSPAGDLHMPFGEAVVDGTGGEVETATFTIHNDGPGDLIISSITLDSGVHFHISGLPCTPFTIAPGGSITGTVTFDPLSGEFLSDTIHVTGDDPDSVTVDIELSGNLVVLNAQTPVYRYHDADGDWTQLTYRGAGQAEVFVAEGIDAVSVVLSGTTSGSRFIVRDMEPNDGSPNTMTAGLIDSIDGASMGLIQFVNRQGVVQNTDIAIGGDLRALRVVGDMANCTLDVGGKMRRIVVTGSMDADSSIHVASSVRVLRIGEGIAGGSTVTIDGDVTRAHIRNDTGPSIAFGSTLTFGSVSGRATLQGDLSGTMDIQGAAVLDGKNKLIQILGDLSGDLLAGLFGNVAITGDFTGNLGDADTAIGRKNHLIVRGANTGTLNPDANIFAEIR